MSFKLIVSGHRREHTRPFGVDWSARGRILTSVAYIMHSYLVFHARCREYVSFLPASCNKSPSVVVFRRCKKKTRRYDTEIFVHVERRRRRRSGREKKRKNVNKTRPFESTDAPALCMYYGRRRGRVIVGNNS